MDGQQDAQSRRHEAAYQVAQESSGRRGTQASRHDVTPRREQSDQDMIAYTGAIRRGAVSSASATAPAIPDNTVIPTQFRGRPRLLIPIPPIKDFICDGQSTQRMIRFIRISPESGNSPDTVMMKTTEATPAKTDRGDIIMIPDARHSWGCPVTINVDVIRDPNIMEMPAYVRMVERPEGRLLLYSIGSEYTGSATPNENLIGACGDAYIGLVLSEQPYIHRHVPKDWEKDIFLEWLVHAMADNASLDEWVYEGGGRQTIRTNW